jgi:spore germination protein
MKHPVDVSLLQFFLLAIICTFGTSAMTLGHSIAKIAKENMCLSVLLGSVLITISFWIAVRLGECFPEHTAIEYHCILLGPVLGRVLNVIMLLNMLMITAIFIRTFSIVLKVYMLRETPPYMILAFLLVAALYAGQYGMAPVLRLQQFCFIPVLSILVVLLFVVSTSIDVTNYQPILAEGTLPVLKGVIPTWFSYCGIELLTGFTYPFLTRKKNAFKYGMYAICLITILYIFIIGITQGILGWKEMDRTMFPSILAYRTVDIPDTFIERLDGYFLSIFIITTFTELVNWIYFISFGIGEMLRLESNRPVVIVLGPMILYFALVPPDISGYQTVGSWINLTSMAWGLGVLPVLLVLAWFKKKRRRKRSRIC